MKRRWFHLVGAVALSALAFGGVSFAAPPFSLEGGTTLIDDSFANLAAVRSVCEDKTMIMQFHPGQLILGGPGENGVCAGAEMGKFSAPAWCLVVEGLSWSHNQAKGGHPTRIALLDGEDRGYGVLLSGGDVELYRQDGDGQMTALAKKEKVFDPSDYTTARNLVFARSSAGELYFSFENQPQSELTATDDTWKAAGKLQLRYGVYLWGYGCEMKSVFLKELAPVAPAAAASVAPLAALNGCRIAIADGEARLIPPRRFGVPAAMARTLAAAGAVPEVVNVADLAASLDSADALIVPAPAMTAAEVPALLQWIRSGKPVLILGTVDWKRETMTPEEKAAVHRFCERILGNGAPPVKTELLEDGNVTPTAVGTRRLGADFPAFQVARAQALPLYNSIEKQSLPAWVAREDWFTVRTKERNWIQQEDIFAASAAQLQRHRAGEFAGARLFISGLPLEGDSPLNPSGAQFAQLTARVLEALAEPVEPVQTGLNDVSAGLPALTRSDFFRYPGAVFGTLCFGDYSYLENDEIFAEDLDMGGFDVVCYCVPWLREPDAEGEVVDWARLDWMLSECRRIGKKLMLDPYPVTFDWRHFSWRRERTGYDPAFAGPFLKALGEIARRCKDDDTLVAMWCTAYTGDVSFPDWSNPGVATPEMLGMWHTYLQERKHYTLESLNSAYGTAYRSWDDVAFPTPTADLPYNLGPAWNDALDFHLDSFQDYMRACIETLRAEIPDLPLTTRGNYLDIGISMAVAAEYKDVATHSECVETTVDTEGYFRAVGRGFGIPITAENGWPKALPSAMHMAMADYLLGDYAAWTYSFAGPRWARDVYPLLNDTARVRTRMNEANAHYPDRAEVGLLVGDTTLYASRPPIFFSIEGLPHLESVFEKSSFPFIGVSAQIPRFRDGMRVLVDDGTNAVLSAAFRDELIGWIGAGGCFVTFPQSGRYTLDGSADFWTAAGLAAAPGRYRLGNGQVIVLDKVENLDPAPLIDLLLSLGVQRDYALSQPMTSAELVSPDGKVRYLVLFDKSTNLVGSFFTESRNAATLAALPDRELRVECAFPFSCATELMTGTELEAQGNSVSLTIPACRMRVIEFR